MQAFQDTGQDAASPATRPNSKPFQKGAATRLDQFQVFASHLQAVGHTNDGQYGRCARWHVSANRSQALLRSGTGARSRRRHRLSPLPQLGCRGKTSDRVSDRLWALLSPLTKRPSHVPMSGRAEASLSRTLRLVPEARVHTPVQSHQHKSGPDLGTHPAHRRKSPDQTVLSTGSVGFPWP